MKFFERMFWNGVRRGFLAAMAAGFLYGCLAATAYSAPVKEIQQEDVAQLSAEIMKRMLDRQQEFGAFPFSAGSEYMVGTTALAIYALVSAGTPANDPRIVKAVQFLNRTSSGSTYEEGLVLLALQKIDPKNGRQRMQAAITRLVDWQGKDGGWGYGIPVTRSDESCTQYAILGISAAQKEKIPIPAKVINNAIDYFKIAQNPNGGWGYAGGTSTFSMTCSGLASLSLLGEELEVPVVGSCGQYRANPVMKKGMNWLSPQVHEFFDQPLRGINAFYALYGFERASILNGIKSYQGKDWYQMGCAKVMSDKDWANNMITASFALLFIARNSAPYGICKLEWNGEWNPDHNDVKNWVSIASERLEQPLDWMNASIRDHLGHAGRASMIYIQGHGTFKATPKELENLRKFLNDGGIVVAEACCNNKAFRKSFLEVIGKKLDPSLQYHFQQLSAGHPILNGKYKLNPKRTSILAPKKGCSRKQIFFLEQELSCSLNGDRNLTKENLEYDRQVATNLLAYALGKRKARSKFEKVSFEEIKPEDSIGLAVNKGDGAAYSFQDPVGRIKFNGEWDSDPNCIQNFVKVFERRSEIPSFDAQIPVDPESDDIYACRLLLLSGHGTPHLSKKAILNLRAYLRNGGRLLIEACCADALFDKGVQALVENLYPGGNLEEIPLSSSLYRSPFVLAGQKLDVTKAWESTFGSSQINPVQGIRASGGKSYVILYVPFDLTCALDGDLEEDIVSLKAKPAAEFLANLILGLIPSVADEEEEKAK